MYEAFYGLKERPFNLTPDPKYLYLSDKHKEAFAHLLFGIKNRSGFVMVTGEIGTGKTTICRNLLKQIDSDNTKIAFVFNPPLNPVELLKKINVEFGISSAPDNALELTEILNKFLLEQASADKNCVLVIDEAQNLSPQVLEQVRLLSNLETETDKLLQIVLIGQPELGEKLALHELRQLNQRITARYHLKALDEHETLQYVAYRLHVAGGRRKIQFSKSAIKSVYRFSGGTPRVINAICDRALLIGYTKEAVNISAGIIKQAAKEIRGEKVVVERPMSSLLRQLLPNPSVALIAAVAVFGIWYIGQKVGGAAEEARRFNDVILTQQPPAAPSNAVEAKAENPGGEAEEKKKQDAARAEVAKALAEKIAPGAVVPAEKAADPGKALRDALEAAAPEAALAGASGALLKAWGVAAAGSPTDGGVDGLAAYLGAQGLSVEKLKPGLEQLISIDLPALVRVKQGPKELWAALVGAENGNVTIALAQDSTMTTPLAVLKEAYLGEAVVAWRDPDPKATALAVGRGGKAVTELKAQLSALGRLDRANQGEQYDQDVARAVSRIQAETGLIIDGVAGRQMRMVMSSWAGGPDVPRLTKAASTVAPKAVDTAVTAAEKPEAKPEPKPEAKPAAKTEGKAEPAMTPLPTPEQLNKAATPAPPVDGVVQVETLPKPDAAAPEAPAPAATPGTPETPKE